MTTASSRLVQLGALGGAVVVGAGLYHFVGGLAGGLYAAAALVFGLLAHFRLNPSSEAVPQSSEPHWNRWGRHRAQLEDLRKEVAAGRALVAERDTHLEVLRGELEEQRASRESLESHYQRELAALEDARRAESTRISRALAELEEELGALEPVVDDLVCRAIPKPHLVESAYEGAGVPEF